MKNKRSVSSSENGLGLRGIKSRKAQLITSVEWQVAAGGL